MKKSEANNLPAGRQVKKTAPKRYDPQSIEPKWQSVWEKERLYHPNLETAKKPFYNLMMFPYPSAEGMHAGNFFTFTGVDIYGRYKRMQGYDVFEPIGLDGFGIHSENYALKVGSHPVEQAAKSEDNFYRQFHATGNGYDWSRTVETYKPDYYKWTQWLFAELFKAGLAYRKKSPVNFCPSCKTVLADEQVIDGKCERCSSIVEKKNLEQWFFRITQYANRLLRNVDKLNWTEKVKTAQRNWIGKSEGLLFTAPVKDSDMKLNTFSAHFEAFKADTFVVIAPDHPLLEKLIENVSNKQEILDFSQKILNKRKENGFAEDNNPEGIFTGKHIVDPVGNGDLPIWVASYALSDYGTGIVKCSAHDERDFAFAKKYGIKLKPVLFPEDPKLRDKVEKLEICYNDMKDGILTEPKEFAGRRAGEVRKEIIDYVVKKGFAKPISQYHLRDWLISRQRYWGPPIPMIYCDACAKGGNGEQEAMPGWYAVSQKDLPVELPYIEDFKPLGSAKQNSKGETINSPLANHPEFYETKCPHCGKEARRETDVSDTFLDSSWYFFRYISTEFADKPFDEERAKKWLPVTMYIGGAEHSVLHLLYARFITMFLKDKGLIPFEEPFARFYAHGLIIKDGAKMSKSKGNIINPDEYIKKYGADTLRTYLHFLGPFDQTGDFRDSGVEGMNRFLKRVWTMLSGQDFSSTKPDSSAARVMHQTIKKVTEEISALRFNTALAQLMTYYNFLSKQDSISHVEAKVYLKLMAPFAPHMAEELWQELRAGQRIKEIEAVKFESIHTQTWPEYDEKHLVSEIVKIPIQINGKLRGMLEVASSDIDNKAKIEDMAKKDKKVVKFLDRKAVRQAIYIEGKVINFVV